MGERVHPTMPKCRGLDGGMGGANEMGRRLQNVAPNGDMDLT